VAVPSLLEKFQTAASKREPLKQVTDAYRIFNGVGDGLVGVTLDRFGDRYQLQFFSEQSLGNYEQIINVACELFDPEFLVAKFRTDPAGRALEHPRMDVVVGTPEQAVGVVREGNAKFHVDLLDTVNPGLFLDMRDVRLEVEERFTQMSQDGGPSKTRDGIANDGLRFLNLFSYTCSFSVHARLGGAAIATNADISGKILDKGRENYALNNLDLRPGEFFKGNAIEYVDWATKKGLRFDGIVLDPPSFARFKGTNFNVREHLMPLAVKCAGLLNPEGFLMVSSNYSGFVLEQFSKDVLAATRNVFPKAHTAWSRSQGADFPGAGLSKESSLVATLVEV
jgi:23S rRNA (cytosine1962-C5)-methyltransferase